MERIPTQKQKIYESNSKHFQEILKNNMHRKRDIERTLTISPDLLSQLLQLQLQITI